MQAAMRHTKMHQETDLVAMVAILSPSLPNASLNLLSNLAAKTELTVAGGLLAPAALLLPLALMCLPIMSGYTWPFHITPASACIVHSKHCETLGKALNVLQYQDLLALQCNKLLACFQFSFQNASNRTETLKLSLGMFVCL